MNGSGLGPESRTERSPNDRRGSDWRGPKNASQKCLSSASLQSISLGRAIGILVRRVAVEGTGAKGGGEVVGSAYLDTWTGPWSGTIQHTRSLGF